MKISMHAPSRESFIAAHSDFLGFLASFRETRPNAQWADLLKFAGSPDKIAVISVDVIKGFCTQGPMFSTRISDMVPEVARIITQASKLGVNDYIFVSDTHPPDSEEFKFFPPHCIEGTPESELEDSLLVLPPVEKYKIIPKLSINSFLETSLVSHLEEIQPRVVVALGDVTDLCYYNLAVNMRMFANIRGWDCRVVAPLCAIETYDIPVKAAESIGILPHDGDFMNAVFAYHMQLTGVEIVKDLL